MLVRIKPSRYVPRRFHGEVGHTQPVGPRGSKRADMVKVVFPSDEGWFFHHEYEPAGANDNPEE